ncbi:HNH endonuclease [Paracoccus sp. M683]|uniref:HNH endonuclease n=1 Tax=Paracoccus sp. M683 TaxID=2594268 RepID=UPI00163D81EC|nr:HNH endonuclease signature motif containing protein [Paracoccus sp. M683]
MKIAEYVRGSLPGIVAFCEAEDAAEFGRLCDRAWSKEVFDLGHPFWSRVETIAPDQSRRYWREIRHVNGIAVRVTSQWFNPPASRSLFLLKQYLTARGLPLPDCALPSEEPSAGKVVRAGASGGRGRYRSPAIGNAQNGLIRSILARIGEESFGLADWQAVVAAFGHRCAYCGEPGVLEMDHVIPINRKSLGEHRLGNLVPSCARCNASKGNRDFREFLADRPQRIQAITTHMERFGYRPIGADPRLQLVFQQAHDELRQLADRYAVIIETVLSGEAGDARRMLPEERFAAPLP